MAISAVSPLNSCSACSSDHISIPPDCQKPSNNRKVIEDFLAEVNRRVKIASKILGSVRRVAAFVRVFVSTPKNLTIAIRGTKLLAGVSGICALPHLISDVSDVITQNDTARRAQAVAWTILSAAEVVSHAAEFSDALEHVGILSERQTAWTSKIQIAFLPLQIVSLGMGAFKVYKINEFRKDFMKFIKSTDDYKPSMLPKAEIIQTLLFIHSYNEKTLRSRLALGKNCKIQECATHLIQKLRSCSKEDKKLALQEGEKLMENFKSRIKKKLAYEIVGIVLEIATLVCAILFFVTASTGAFALGAMAFLSVSSLALFAYNKTALTRYPSFLA
jgi:hypothetical protein